MNVRALLSPALSLWCYSEEVGWEEICRCRPWGPISGVCSPPNSQWTVVTLTESTTPIAIVRDHVRGSAFSFIAQPQGCTAETEASLLNSVG